MSYRNITVDGVDYKYVVGKTCTKIHGIRKIFYNSDIGIQDTTTFKDRYMVRPLDVATAIKSVVGQKSS